MKKLLLLTLMGGALLAFLASFQRKLLYFPSRSDEGAELGAMARAGLEAVRSREGDVLAFRSPHPAGAEAILLVAHGNAGAASDRTYFVELARGASTRFEVWLVEYPGYGSRRGTPSELGNVAAMVEAIDRAKERRLPLVLLGESIGSAVVSLAAAERPSDARALVLVTPLPNLARVAAHHYPFIPTMVLADRYEADVALARYGGPAAFVLAAHDEVIPASMGRSMHDAYAGPKLLEVDPEASHNTLDFTPSLASWQRVFDWVGRTTLTAREAADTP